MTTFNRETVLFALQVHEATIKPSREKWQAVRKMVVAGDTNWIMRDIYLEEDYRASVREADKVYFETIGE